ncbi:unnamed protein product [Gadus morhua 'NCC']
MRRGESQRETWAARRACEPHPMQMSSPSPLSAQVITANDCDISEVESTRASGLRWFRLAPALTQPGPVADALGQLPRGHYHGATCVHAGRSPPYQAPRGELERPTATETDPRRPPLMGHPG